MLARDFPRKIEVEKQRPVELSLGVVRSAQVRVRLAVFASIYRNLAPDRRPAGPDKYEEKGTLAGGLVEVSNGKETWRQVTDRDGRVTFENLRPGRWTLRVYDNGLPDHHVVETPKTELLAEPGQVQEASVRVLPQNRRIQMILDSAVEGLVFHGKC